MGREKQTVYQYADATENYRYIRSYESKREVFVKYFDGKIGELFHNGAYKRLPDGTIVTNKKLGRVGLVKLIREKEDPTIFKRNDDKPIYIFNGKQELVGTISNIRVLEAILEDSPAVVRNKLSRNKQFARTHFKGLNYLYDYDN